MTWLNVDNTKNYGGLLYMIPLKENGNDINSDIYLQLLYKDLRITYNYYIYLWKDSVNKLYQTFSNFCFFKVLNCYESCKNCSYNIPGTKEIHEYTECKNNYYIFPLNSNETGYYNCYKNDSDDLPNHYYLNKEDKKYYECDFSCKTCENDTICKECSDGYYYKSDKFINDKLNDICFNTHQTGYFLNSSKVYEKCYKTCLECFGKGDSINNMCLECKPGFKNYSYNKYKCTTDIKNCSNYWKINSTNDIECINNREGYIIYSGINKNQSADNC